MKEKIETILSNNKARTLLTVMATAIIVTACIGLGSTLAAPKSDESPVSAIGDAAADQVQAVTSDALEAEKEKNIGDTGTAGDSSNKEQGNSNNPPSDSTKSSVSDKYIGDSKAKSIALSRVGGGSIISCHLDYDDGVVKYEIEIIRGKYEYELEIDAKNGSVLDFEKEYIDYNENDHHFDHDDHDHDDHHDD